MYVCAGLRPTDVDVIELHDCFATNELITYEALGLCKEGELFGGEGPSETSVSMPMYRGGF